MRDLGDLLGWEGRWEEIQSPHMYRLGWGFLAFLISAPSLLGGLPKVDPLLPPSTGGIEAVDRAFRQLTTHRRVLIIGAHPDDEDNRLLTLVSKGLGGEAAYLSLSRGEGGQNLLGAELGVALGLLRTGELLAARRLEGSRQYFARAFDFGYTHSLEETFRRWPREVLQEDAVRVVRRFKPQVIVAVFPADDRAGHGQHQASAVIAADVMEMAGSSDQSPDRYPKMTERGLLPWQPKALYRVMRWNPKAGAVDLHLEAVDPMSGKSVLQLAGASRSMHRSQDMGQVQELGPKSAKLTWVAGESGEDAADIFDGIDTSLAGIAAVLQTGALRTEVEGRLRRIESQARQSHGRLSPLHLERSASELVDIARALKAVLDLLTPSFAPAAPVVAQLVAEKVEATERGLVAAAGVFIEATADREGVIPVVEFQAEASVWASGRSEVEVAGVRAVSSVGWRSEANPRDAGLEESDAYQTWTFAVSAPTGSRPTTPSFLSLPRDGDLYDWSEVSFQQLGEPLDRPPLEVEFKIEIESWPMTLTREVVYRYGDQSRGEVRRPLRAVPALEVSVEPDLILWPIRDTKGRELEIVLKSNQRDSIGGTVHVELPAEWVPPQPLAFRIEEPFGSINRKILLRALEEPQASTYEGSVVVVTEDGKRFTYSVPVVDYDHIRPAPRVEEATFQIRSFEFALPQLRRVGYIRGAADRSPEVLLRVGFPVEVIAPEDLTKADFSQFDAMIVGPRAYEVNQGLAGVNARLLEFARGGGLLLVQYQQYQFVEGGFAPFQLEISRPHDRITDEASKVRLLDPQHPVFTTPNRLNDRDWENWVQERGLYFAHRWANDYTPLLAMRDPAKSEQLGGLLVAPLGEGLYIYTGLSFFRQLPAGVPGALRLMSNLLGLADTVDK